MRPYAGNTFLVEFSEDAGSSFDEAAARAPAKCVENLLARLKKFADGGKLHTPGQLNVEGDGFFSIKARCGLRAYWWYDRQRRWVIVISHFILKKTQKLSRADKDRMKKNRRSYEERTRHE